MKEIKSHIHYHSLQAPLLHCHLVQFYYHSSGFKGTEGGFRTNERIWKTYGQGKLRKYVIKRVSKYIYLFP
jgi:hypothetical protein